MFYDLSLAWRNICSRPVQTAVTLIVIGLAIALTITVVQLNDGLKRGIIQASDAFGVLVVGAKGSSQQLVTSTILLQGNPIGNIDHSILDELRNDPRIATAIPIAMGDNVGGARVIGTDQTFFKLSRVHGGPPAFTLRDGRLFEEDFEAVLGHRAARQLGLQIGDNFLTQHGVERGLESDLHDTPHRVVGILEESTSPYDNAIFTTVNSIIAVHSTHGFGNQLFVDQDDEHSNEHSNEHADEESKRQITAILVSPVGFAEMNQIWQDFYMGTQAQAAFPGKELGGLFELFNQGQTLLIRVGYLAALMAGLTLFLAIYSASAAREPFIALMRSVGANRRNVFRMVIGETVLLTLLGTAVGRVIGFASSYVLAGQIASQSAIPVPLRFLPSLEPSLWLVPLCLGVLAGLIPAMQAYRVNAIDKLSQT